MKKIITLLAIASLSISAGLACNHNKNGESNSTHEAHSHEGNHECPMHGDEEHKGHEGHENHTTKADSKKK